VIDQIRAESIRTLYYQMRNTSAAVFIIIAYMIGATWKYNPWGVIVGWTAVILLFQLAREALIRQFQRRNPGDEALESWARAFVVHQALAAVAWGSSMFLFAHPDQPVTVALTVCALFSVAAGAVPAQAYTPASLNTLVTVLFSLALVRLLATGDVDYIVLGVASSFFAMAMMAYCRVQSRVVREGFRIRFENKALVEALTAQKIEAEGARHQAELASLAKSQFLAAASHDLRQPLYALSLFSASLSALKLDDDGRKVVGNIQESIAAMEALFVGLLDLSRLDAGVVQPRLEPVSVDALFDRLSQYFLPIAIERGLDLRFRSDGEWVTSDVTLIEQVLSNLVSNALRCTKQGAVLIAARARGPDVRLEVWDTGIGIDEADRKRIFEEFVQIDNPERDRRKGLGLGLSIAQRSAALIGGAITMSSRLGRGSRFTVMQPLMRPPGVPVSIGIEPAWNDPKLTLSSDLPLLIVEDDRDVRTALGNLLTRWGVHFDFAVDAKDALIRVETGKRYGLVLADYRLPGALNGLDLIAAITQLHPKPLPAYALITGDFDPDLIGTAHARGVPLFQKPLKPAKLRVLLGLPDLP
jgi:signal transduction histidine kinase/CheY-like chemotaxis protein